MKKTIFLIIIVFMTGWFFSSAYSMMTDSAVPVPLPNEEATDIDTLGTLVFGTPPEKISPYDHITEDQIHVFNDRVIIDLKDAEWARFTDTNSMDPIIDETAHAIEKRPTSSDEIHVGDIVSYRSIYADGIIIHRVVEIGEDEDGWFCRMKGDNNPFNDPGKIRFDKIERYVVAIIY